jgi:hypothetical protein
VRRSKKDEDNREVLAASVPRSTRGVAAFDGLLVHIGRATTDGFQALEVWESKEHCDRANTDIVFPLMRELAGDQPPPSTEPATETFDVRGLEIPSGNILI